MWSIKVSNVIYLNKKCKFIRKKHDKARIGGGRGRVSIGERSARTACDDSGLWRPAEELDTPQTAVLERVGVDSLLCVAATRGSDGTGRTESVVCRCGTPTERMLWSDELSRVSRSWRDAAPVNNACGVARPSAAGGPRPPSRDTSRRRTWSRSTLTRRTAACFSPSTADTRSRRWSAAFRRPTPSPPVPSTNSASTRTGSRSSARSASSYADFRTIGPSSSNQVIFTPLKTKLLI